MRDVSVGAEIVGTAVNCIAEAEVDFAGTRPQQRVGHLAVNVIHNCDRRGESAGLDIVRDRVRAIRKSDDIRAAYVLRKMSGKGRGDGNTGNGSPTGERGGNQS